MNNSARYRRLFFLVVTLLAVAMTVLSANAVELSPVAAGKMTIHAFLGRYCIQCHGPETQKGERRFDHLSLAATTPDALLELQEIVDMLNLGDMPPEDAERHPHAGEVRSVVEQLTKLVADGHAHLASTGGRTVLRRMNRREYLNTVGDLLALNMTMFDPATNFPRDQMVQQMDNIGDTLRMSGFLLAQYLDAADQVMEKAFDRLERPQERVWRFDGDFHGTPLNYVHGKAHYHRYLYLEQKVSSIEFRGGYGYIPNFDEGVPADGWYEIRVKAEALHRINPYDPKLFERDPAEPFRMGVVAGNAEAGPLEKPQPIEPLLGEVVLKDNQLDWYSLRVWLDRGYTPRFVFVNGTLRVARAIGRILNEYRDTFPIDIPRYQIGDNHIVMLRHGQFPQIRIHEIQVRGPLVKQWPSATEHAIFGDISFAPERTRQILKRFADRAYRRPARADEVDSLMGVVQRRLRDGDTPLNALKEGLKAALCSPGFVYLNEPQSESTGNQKLTAHALATRLSYFIWSTMPDAELRQMADNGKLLQPDVLVAQLRRMLASPRSDAFVASFLDSWLNLRSLGDMMPAMDAFPQVYADSLLPAMKRETQLFARDLIDRNDSVARFIDSDYTFVNRPLARLYGMEDAVDPQTGHQFRRIPLDTPRRGGLLGQASVLTVSANGIETSPVTRGVWVLENFLGTPPAPPPDDVPVIEPDTRGAFSVRDILAKHRNTPACYDCHRKIDPLGFALENFDPVGAWRQRYDNGVPIDTAGQLPGGQPFEDIAGLKKLLLERNEQFARALTERLLSYACGRRMEPLDRPEIDRILEATSAGGYRFRDLLEQVVLSQPFRSK